MIRSYYECSIDTTEKIRKMEREVLMLKENTENVTISIRQQERNQMRSGVIRNDYKCNRDTSENIRKDENRSFDTERKY